ncbi:hypothetical protein GGR50DRAFT_641121 [Xylaria sp. CBS 124048]|nr:hypothetical protein GGR50DRAFT_641121 [Xylaria sp. CBS 124048]
MDPANTSTAPLSLEGALAIPIAQLCPDLSDPSTKAVGGVVTITWPYNSVTNTFACYLAEPDFRLRRKNGQVRIDFTGRAARAARDCELRSNDEVLLGLDGVAWEAEIANRRQSLPDGLGWRLVFAESLFLKIKRAETGKIDTVIVNKLPVAENGTPPGPTPVQSLPETKSPSPPTSISPIRIRSPVRGLKRKELIDGEFASPAFIKRAKMSYGSLFEGDFDIFEDDDEFKDTGRKRIRFGRDSRAWRYTSRSVSPELAAASPKSVNEHTSSPTRPAGSPAKVDMIDEGCQVMDVDQSSAQPIASLEAHASSMSPKLLPVDALSADMPQSLTEQGTPTACLDTRLSETTVQVPSIPVSIDVPASQMDISSLPGQRQYDAVESNFTDKAWDMPAGPYIPELQSQAPTAHLHMNVFASPAGAENTTFGTQPPPSNEVDSSVCQPHSDNDEARTPLSSGYAKLTELNSPAVNYPPFDVSDDTHPSPVHHQALTNYPASYLDIANASQSGQMIKGEAPEYSEAAALGAPSWPTVNHNSRAAVMHSMNRLDSGDRGTPEQPLIIDDSDSESDSNLAPIVADDTTSNGHAHALSTHEDVEADDEADAQYSDDDELGYDEEEIGGDYDARNYEKPDDDEDDSHDDDLRSHPLEPEFGNEESWDESDQGDYYEEDYESEMSDKGRDPPRQSAAPAGPIVIDLISSSEDENESEHDEDDVMTDMPPSSARFNSRVEPNPQQVIHPSRGRLHERGFEMMSRPPASQVDHSSVADIDVRAFVRHRGEEEDEGDDVNEDLKDDESEEGEEEEEEEEDEDGEEEDEYGEEEEDEDEEDKSGEGSLEDDAASQDEFEEGGGGDGRRYDQDKFPDESEPEVDEPDAIQMLERSQTHTAQQGKAGIGPRFNADPDTNVAPDSNHDREGPSDQTTLNAKLPETIDIAASSRIPGKNSADLPLLFAADGLELLSRVVDEESKIINQKSLDSAITKEVVAENIHDKQLLARSPHEGDVQMRDSPNHREITISEVNMSERFPAHGPADPVIPSKGDTEDQPSIIDQWETAVVAQSTPPPTQSFPPRLGDNVIFTFDKITVNPADQKAAAHLPTPLNSQIADMGEVVSNHRPSSQINSVEVFGSSRIIERNNVETGEVVVMPKDTAGRPLPQDIGTNADEHSLEQRDDSALEFLVRGLEPPNEPSAAISPPASFETRADDEQLASSSSISQEEADNRPSPKPRPEYSSNVSDTWSFGSHMEVDEELQASILENSQLEGDPNYGQSFLANGIENTTVPSKGHANLDSIGQLEAVPSLSNEDTPEKQIAEELSAHLKRNLFDAYNSFPEISGALTDNSSVSLARLSIAYKKARENGNALSREKHEKQITEELSMQLKKTFEDGSISAEDSDVWMDNFSVSLARSSIISKRAGKDGRGSVTPRASLSSQTSKLDEDSPSMAMIKLQLSRHLRDELLDCASLKVLRQHLTKSLDVIAVAAMQPPEPRRAKGGPRECMMSFTISDHSIGPYAVAEVLIYRPYKDKLPVIKYGDIVLLRNFTVVSLADKGFGLRSNEASSWAVFDYEDEPPQIRGPPVEYDERETLYVGYLREWFRLLNAKARAKLERANKDIINAKKSKQSRDGL